VISSQFFVEKILWSSGFLYVLTVSLEKVQARHNLPHDNDAKPTNKIYIPHFNFPVRRTGPYRHKIALVEIDGICIGSINKGSGEWKLEENGYVQRRR